MTISPRTVLKISFTIFVSMTPGSVYMVFCTNTFLRRTAGVNFDEKRLKHVSQTSSKPIFIEDVSVTETYGSLGITSILSKVDTQTPCFFVFNFSFPCHPLCALVRLCYFIVALPLPTK